MRNPAYLPHSTAIATGYPRGAPTAIYLTGARPCLQLPDHRLPVRTARPPIIWAGPRACGSSPSAAGRTDPSPTTAPQTRIALATPRSNPKTHRRARGDARRAPRGPGANHADERPRRAATPASHPATLVSHPHNRGSRIQPSHADHQKEPIPGQPEISHARGPEGGRNG